MKQFLENINWFDVVPTTMSAFAAIAAAYAAIVSMRVSKQSNSIAEMTAIATHHNSAASTYFDVVSELSKETKPLKELSYRLWNDWSQEIGHKDNRNLGGVNPRPLRHVLSDSSEMLATYGMLSKNWGPNASNAILSVIRHSIGEMNDTEYKSLLKAADGEYQDFDTTFGTPSVSKKISSAPAFRFACYQLLKRVETEDWVNIWENSWLENGWLARYKKEYLRIKPILENALDSLNRERAKLAHTSFPLDVNPELFIKYENALNTIHHLIIDGDPSNLESYRDWPYKDELSRLVMCSMAIVTVTRKNVDILGSKSTLSMN